MQNREKEKANLGGNVKPDQKQPIKTPPQVGGDKKNDSNAKPKEQRGSGQNRK